MGLEAPLRVLARGVRPVETDEPKEWSWKVEASNRSPECFPVETGEPKEWSWKTMRVRDTDPRLVSRDG